MLIERLINAFYLHKERVKFNKDIKTNGILFIRNSTYGRIEIGHNVIINSSVCANPVSGVKTKLCTSKEGIIVIGDNVGISNSTIYSCSEIQIEDNVLIGAGSFVVDSDFHATDYQDRLSNINTKVAKVKICEGAFIGSNVMVLKGVTIGRHSVIGAGSVVTQNVPDGEIWAGNPARYIKKVRSSSTESNINI